MKYSIPPHNPQSHTMPTTSSPLRKYRKRVLVQKVICTALGIIAVIVAIRFIAWAFNTL